MTIQDINDILGLVEPVALRITRDLKTSLILTVSQIEDALYAGQPLSVAVGDYSNSEEFQCRITCFEKKAGFSQSLVTNFKFEAFRVAGPMNATGFSGFHVHGSISPVGELNGWTGRYNATPDWVRRRK